MYIGNSIDEFEKLLYARSTKEPIYGVYDARNDSTVMKISLFKGGSESLLEDIY